MRDAVSCSIHRKGVCVWSKTKCSYCNIDKNMLVEMIEYLVDNNIIFVHVGGTLFRQGIGIPMETDCAPLLANLYLFFYEYTYMRILLMGGYKIS